MLYLVYLYGFTPLDLLNNNLWVHPAPLHSISSCSRCCSCMSSLEARWHLWGDIAEQLGSCFMRDDLHRRWLYSTYKKYGFQFFKPLSRTHVGWTESISFCNSSKLQSAPLCHKTSPKDISLNTFYFSGERKHSFIAQQMWSRMF